MMQHQYPVLMKAFRLVSCIKKINDCDSLGALMALKKVLDDRIKSRSYNRYIVKALP